MSTNKVSFARPVAKATVDQAKPVTPVVPAQTVTTATPTPSAASTTVAAANVNVVPAASTTAVAVVQPQSHAVAIPTYGGEEEVDVGDIRFPRLNIAQKTSAAELVQLGLGNFILNKETKLGTALRAVVVGFQPKKYSEKVKYGAPQGAMANSLEEVEALGGTILWRESKENPASGSTKPWFQPMVTGLLLIEKPEGSDDERFVYEADGKFFAPALFTVKSTSYESFYVKLNSEQKLGLLRKGYPTRYIELKSDLRKFTGGEAYVPQVRVLDETTEGVRELAKNLRG